VKVLVTGAAGFIGFHLAKRMAVDGLEVHMADNFKRGIRDASLEELMHFDNVSFFDIDCLQSERLSCLAKDYDFIFHLAAIVGVDNVIKNPYRVMVDNCKLLENLLEFARTQKKLKRFFYPSTSEVTAGTLAFFDLKIPTPENVPLTLTDLDQPRTSYMLSKLAGEFMVRHSDIPYTIFRPHNIYGPRMGLSHVIPGQLKKAFYAANGESIVVSSVNHTRCFCYVDDAVEILVRLMERTEAQGGLFNIGSSGPEITIGTLAGMCHAAVLPKIVCIKPGETQQGSPVRRIANMERTIATTNYTAQIDLKDGIARTFRWYKEWVFVDGGISAV